jgi:hypothetical protein
MKAEGARVHCSVVICLIFFFWLGSRKTRSRDQKSKKLHVMMSLFFSQVRAEEKTEREAAAKWPPTRPL